MRCGCPSTWRAGGSAATGACSRSGRDDGRAGRAGAARGGRAIPLSPVEASRWTRARAIRDGLVFWSRSGRSARSLSPGLRSLRSDRSERRGPGLRSARSPLARSDRSERSRGPSLPPARSDVGRSVRSDRSRAAGRRSARSARGRSSLLVRSGPRILRSAAGRSRTGFSVLGFATFGLGACLALVPGGALLEPWRRDGGFGRRSSIGLLQKTAGK